MFHTYPEAELPLPQAFSPNGERAWYWIECGMKFPYFLMVLKFDAGPYIETRTLFFNSLPHLLEIVEDSDVSIRARQVYLLSTPRVNASEHLAFDEVSRVWADELRIEMAILLKDGRYFRHVHGETQLRLDTAFDAGNLRLVLDM